jgi:hypothetical protein
LPVHLKNVFKLYKCDNSCEKIAEILNFSVEDTLSRLRRFGVGVLSVGQAVQMFGYGDESRDNNMIRVIVQSEINYENHVDIDGGTYRVYWYEDIITLLNLNRGDVILKMGELIVKAGAFTTEDLAGLLGLNHATVRSRLCRARIALREKLKWYRYGAE